MSVRRVLAAALLVPLALLGACSDDEPVPKMPKTSSSTPSPTESESTAAPETPEEFIRRWAAVEATMQNTGETGEYRELSAECDGCIDLADNIDTFYAAGGYVKWGGWRIRTVRPYSEGDDDAFAVRVVSAPTTYVASKGGAKKSLPGGPVTYIVTIAESASGLTVVDKAQLQ